MAKKSLKFPNADLDYIYVYIKEIRTNVDLVSTCTKKMKINKKKLSNLSPTVYIGNEHIITYFRLLWSFSAHTQN